MGEDPAVEAYLETGRLTLRRFTPDEAGLLVDLDSDLEVMRFLTGRPTPPGRRPDPGAAGDPGDVRPVPAARQVRGPRAGRGRFVGWFGLQPTGRGGRRRPRVPLRRDAWGHGYATEGSRALVAKAFTELDVAKVVATTMAVNARSRQVMRRTGLRFVRVFHQHFDDPLPGTEHGEWNTPSTAPVAALSLIQGPETGP
jgi:RimJ/RimL family protein N-acetyltransferase